MRVIRRGLMVGVCILLCCIACSGALADAGNPTLVFGNEKDIVQDVPEDQRVVFEDMMEYLGIDPLECSHRYWRVLGINAVIHGPAEEWAKGWNRKYVNPAEELMRVFPCYKVIRFYPQLPTEVYLGLGMEYDFQKRYYIAYDCMDGSTVFFFIGQKHQIQMVIRMYERCTPEAFKAIQMGMLYEDSEEIDPNAAWEMGDYVRKSWHWLSDGTFARVIYEKQYDSENEQYVYRVVQIKHFASYEEASGNGMMDTFFDNVNPADFPE